MADKKWRSGPGGLVALLLLGLAHPASAAEVPRFWAKSETTGAVMMSDLDACAVEAKDVHANIQPPTYYAGSGGLAGVLGAAIGAAIASSIAEHGARAGYIRRCMHAHGYAHVPMSAEDAAAFKGLKTSADKAAWTQAVYDKPDFPARLEASLTPPVPLLPVAAPEPLTYSGLSFDPAALSAAAGVVVKGGQALAGPVAHRRTARAVNAFAVPGVMGAELAKDEVLYQAVLPGEDDPRQTYWCGQVAFNSLTGHHRSPMCFYTDENGYVAVSAVGQPWHLSGIIPEQKPSRFFNGSTLTLAESDTDLLGSMDFGVYVTKIGKTAVTFAARLTHDGKSETLWTGEAAFDAQGQAVLPFWSHRLVATRAGDGVTVAFTPDGDGVAFDGVRGA